MLTQVDKEGLSTTSTKAIINYRKDESITVPKHDMYVDTSQGRNKLRKTTVGWSLLMMWGKDSESWISLKDLK